MGGAGSKGRRTVKTKVGGIYRVSGREGEGLGQRGVKTRGEGGGI